MKINFKFKKLDLKHINALVSIVQPDDKTRRIVEHKVLYALKKHTDVEWEKAQRNIPRSATPGARNHCLNPGEAVEPS